MSDSSSVLHQTPQQTFVAQRSKLEDFAEKLVAPNVKDFALMMEDGNDYDDQAAQDNYEMGHLIHGTDVSASYSQLPVNQLDSFSDLNAAQINHATDSQKQPVSHQIERLAANLKVKGSDAEQDAFIVGGGEIDVMESSQDADEGDKPPHDQVLEVNDYY